MIIAKKNITLYTIIFILFFTSFSTAVDAEADTSPSMRIHGIYLGQFKEKTDDDESTGGDAVLLESDGEYILMDTGRNNSQSVKYLKNYLNKNNVKELSLYISHLHLDHFGAYAAVFDNYDVTTLYLPDKSIASQCEDSPAYYEELEAAASDEGSNIVYLDKGDNFSVGDADFDIIAPVDKKLKLSNFKSDSYGSKSGHYVNNYSLVSMITCGDKKYFTGGDIEEEAEKKLITEYGTALKADIMKLNHHGIATSNKTQFLKCLKPTYSFFMYSGDQRLRKSSNNGKMYRRGYTSRKNANEYGICYVVNDEAKDLIIDVDNDGVRMYRGNIESDNRLIGWVEVQGGDGKYLKKDKFYIDPDTGKPRTKYLQWGDKLYYMGNGGCMYRGIYSANGKYNGWRKINGNSSKMVYINKSGVLYRGFKIVNKYRRYFDKKTGCRVYGKKSGTVKQIGNYKYSFNNNGVIYRSGWKKYKKDSTIKYRYFSKKTGAMKKGGWITIGKKLYYFKNDGYVITGNKKWKIKKINSKKYAINEKGVIYRGGWKKYKKNSNIKYRYFSKKSGAMKKGGWITIGKKLYYFKNDGYVITGNKKWKIKKINSKKYAINEKGVIYRGGWKKYKMGTTVKYRYFNKKTGEMTTGKTTIKNREYKFDKSGYCLNK